MKTKNSNPPTTPLIAFGTGSEYFNIDTNGVIRAKTSFFDSGLSSNPQEYEFFLKATDSYGRESVSKVKIRIVEYFDT